MKLFSSVFALAVAMWATNALAIDVRALSFGQPTTTEISTESLRSIPSAPSVPSVPSTPSIPSPKDKCAQGLLPAQPFHSTDVAQTPATPTDTLDLPIDDIINAAKQVWAIVVANKPVVNVQTDFADALPRTITNWQDLECWSNPVVKTYRTTYKNLYGMTPVTFEYQVIYTYGGRDKGHGRFLTNVTVVPSSLDVAWGYTFDADVTVPNIVNTGTSRDPIAGIQLQVNYKVRTVLKESRTADTYFVRGDGYFQQNPN